MEGLGGGGGVAKSGWHGVGKLVVGVARGGSGQRRCDMRIVDLACPFLYWSQCKKGHAESAFRGACRTFSGVWLRVGCYNY